MPSYSKERHLEMGEIIYGPVLSRRLGVSLGINPLPLGRKSCTFDCVYCQLGGTDDPVSDPSSLRDYPSSEEVVNAFERKLENPDLPNIDAITVSGNGEPTLNPELGELVRRIRATRDEKGVRAPISIMTNSSLLNHSSVQQSLSLFDSVVAKLDTVDRDCFLAMNRPVKGVRVGEIVEGLKRLRAVIGERFILQVMVIDSKGDGHTANHGEERVRRLAEAISKIEPAQVQVYSLDRRPSEPHVSQVDSATLKRVGRVISRKMGRGRVDIY